MQKANEMQHIRASNKKNNVGPEQVSQHKDPFYLLASNKYGIETFWFWMVTGCTEVL